MVMDVVCLFTDTSSIRSNRRQRGRRRKKRSDVFTEETWQASKKRNAYKESYLRRYFSLNEERSHVRKRYTPAIVPRSFGNRTPWFDLIKNFTKKEQQEREKRRRKRTEEKKFRTAIGVSIMNHERRSMKKIL